MFSLLTQERDSRFSGWGIYNLSVGAFLNFDWLSWSSVESRAAVEVVPCYNSDETAMKGLCGRMIFFIPSYSQAIPLQSHCATKLPLGLANVQNKFITWHPRIHSLICNFLKPGASFSNGQTTSWYTAIWRRRELKSSPRLKSQSISCFTIWSYLPLISEQPDNSSFLARHKLEARSRCLDDCLRVSQFLQ